MRWDPNFIFFHMDSQLSQNHIINIPFFVTEFEIPFYYILAYHIVEFISFDTFYPSIYLQFIIVQVVL